MKLQEGNYRQSTAWLRQRLSYRSVIALEGSNSIEDELWILLEYYSEVESVGLKFVETNGVTPRNKKIVYKHFQSFVRQAKNYYYSAKTLHPRSASLLYYYCFLNLAKAALILKDPHIGHQRHGHGISSLPKDFNKLKKQTITIQRDGIFSRFYELYFGEKIKSQTLNIEKLLNYCTDIAYQNLLAGIGNPMLLRAYFVLEIDRNNHTGWPLIGISRIEYCKTYKKAFGKLYEKFEKIELPMEYGKVYFQKDSAFLSEYTFLQSKEVIKWPSENMAPTIEIRNLLIDTLDGRFQPNYHKSDFDCYITLPYLKNNQLRMNETTAIYLIMFYLSNLVRYNPYYLEELLTKKESWLIDSFIRSCPLTFLRSMISFITNIDYVMSER